MIDVHAGRSIMELEVRKSKSVSNQTIRLDYLIINADFFLSR